MPIITAHVLVPAGTRTLLADIPQGMEDMAKYGTLVQVVDYAIEIYVPPRGHTDNPNVDGVYVGGADVSLDNGRWIPAGAAWSMDLPVNAEAYAVSPGAAVTLHVTRVMDR